MYDHKYHIDRSKSTDRYTWKWWWMMKLGVSVLAMDWFRWAVSISPSFWGDKEKVSRRGELWSMKASECAAKSHPVVLDFWGWKFHEFPHPFWHYRLSCQTIFRWISDIYYDLIITLILLGGFSCHFCSAARILAGRNLPRLRSEESLFFIPSHIKVRRLLKEWERRHQCWKDLTSWSFSGGKRKNLRERNTYQEN